MTWPKSRRRSPLINKAGRISAATILSPPLERGEFQHPRRPSPPPRRSGASISPVPKPSRWPLSRPILGRPRPQVAGGRPEARVGVSVAHRGDLDPLSTTTGLAPPVLLLENEGNMFFAISSRSAVLMEFWWKKNKKPQLHPPPPLPPPPGFPSPENQPRSSSLRIASEMLHTSISPSSLIRLKWESFVIRIAFA